MRDVRSRIWISPFQSWLFVRVGVYWFFYTITLFNFLFVWRLIQEGPGDIADQFGRCCVDNAPLFLCFLLVAPWIALDSVRFANRVVGPLHRFRSTMKKITANEPVATIRLRKHDFLMDMQDDFNAMIEALKVKGAVQISVKQSHTGEALPTATR